MALLVVALDQLFCLFLEVKRELEQSLLNLLILAYSLISLVTLNDVVYSSLALKQHTCIDVQRHYLLGKEPHRDFNGRAGITCPEVKHSLVDDELLRNDLNSWIAERRLVVFGFVVAKKMHAFVLLRRDVHPEDFKHVVPSIVASLCPHSRDGLLISCRLGFHLIRSNKL